MVRLVATATAAAATMLLERLIRRARGDEFADIRHAADGHGHQGRQDRPVRVPKPFRHHPLSIAQPVMWSW